MDAALQLVSKDLRLQLLKTAIDWGAAGSGGSGGATASSSSSSSSSREAESGPTKAGPAAAPSSSKGAAAGPSPAQPAAPAGSSSGGGAEATMSEGASRGDSSRGGEGVEAEADAASTLDAGGADLQVGSVLRRLRHSEWGGCTAAAVQGVWLHASGVLLATKDHISLSCCPCPHAAALAQPEDTPRTLPHRPWLRASSPLAWTRTAWPQPQCNRGARMTHD